MAKSATVKRKAVRPEPVEAIVAWKGFTSDLRCANDFQFKVGETYTHRGSVAACSSGFHACLNPLDVWAYYSLSDGNRFCRVHLSGKTDAHDSDTKIAAETIFIESEVTLGEMIRAGVEYTVNTTKGKGDDPSGHYAQIGSSGDYAVIAAAGVDARAKGAVGTWIALPEYRYDNRKGRYLCLGFAIGCIGQDGLKPDTFYRAENGKLVEVC